MIAPLHRYWREHDLIDGKKRDASTRDKSDEQMKEKRRKQQKREKMLERRRAGEKFDRTAFAVVDNVNLAIAQSTIVEAGKGLFARRAFEDGERITIYEGELITFAEAVKRRKENKHSHIRSHLQRRVYIDGARLANGDLITEPETELFGLGGGAFANHKPEAEANAEFDYIDSEENEKLFDKLILGRVLDPNERITFIRATRDIAAGEEIFLNYGEDYWLGDE